jgi:hypothetical protein
VQLCGGWLGSLVAVTFCVIGQPDHQQVRAMSRDHTHESRSHKPKSDVFPSGKLQSMSKINSMTYHYCYDKKATYYLSVNATQNAQLIEN